MKANILNTENSGREILKPRKLQIGQTVGVIAPSSPARQSEEIDSWLERIEELGFQVKRGQHLYDRHGYLSLIHI